MRKIWFIGIGVTLFSVAGLLYVTEKTTNNSDYRVVSGDESQKIWGGGQPGASYSVDTCGGGTGSCWASGYVSNGSGTQQATQISTCGGNCGNIASAIGNAPE
jgi:hypothetical protein